VDSGRRNATDPRNANGAVAALRNQIGNSSLMPEAPLAIRFRD